MTLPFLDQFEIVDFQLVQDLNLWQLLASGFCNILDFETFIVKNC